MIEQNLILILVLLPFLGALAAATLPVNAHNAAAWVSGLVLAGGLVILAMLHAPVSEGRVLRVFVQWVPSLRLNLPFRVDGFAWFFVTLVLSIGVLVVIYARYYLSRTDPVPRFYSFLLAFTGAMVGLLLSGNILMLVVFWELTSITSFLLIGYWNQSQAARDGARMALIVTAVGGLCLLVAMLVLGQIVGAYDLDRVLASGDVIRAHPLYPLVLVLFLIGAFTKSAQFPFHFWLPGAMAAPTPVSAFLHSATMVKAGVFLLVRFSPTLGGTELWFFAVTGTGMATLLIGAVIALFRHDLKGLLAYSTISHLGLITALAGIGSTGAIVAAIFHIANHAVFKASLFMAAGIIDHETGTRDMRKLSGLFRAMPFTGTLAIVASAAMAGVPLLNGFLSKEMFFAEAVDWHNGTWLDNSLPYIATAASIFSVAYSVRFIATVFFGPPASDLPKQAHEPSPWMRRPVELLVFVCLAVGIFPGLTLGPVLNDAARAVVGADLPHQDIAIWHGLNWPLYMSLIAMAVGTLIYIVFARRISAGPEGPPVIWRVRAQRIYEKLLLELTWKLPRRLHGFFGTERLQPQLRLLVLLAVVCLGVTLWGALSPVQKPLARTTALNPAFLLMWGVGAACAIGAAWQAKYHRFAALVLLGGAGLVTCLTFAWFSAPDLAVTQLLVEIVTTVLLLLGLRWLPRRREEIAADKLLPAKIRRGRDLVIALVSGAGLAALSYVVMTRPLIPNVGDWFLRNAYYEGGGTNTVNVILVDFRAFDTFGEITVLAIVGLTVYALLRRFRPAAESSGVPDQQKGEVTVALKDYMLVPSAIMRWMFPVLIVISAYLFFRGHDLPGGGFSSGVTLAIALLLQYIASNVRWIEARIVILPIRWMGIGLLIAGATGVGAWLVGYPFLTAHAQYVDVPLIGKVPAATALIFDLGVFALVVGATVLMLIAIAHQSLRSARQREQEAEADKKEAL
ncbi:multisubunit potassium/proton antiporter, PhaA subunit /multisubunit potassium/proton antiporter, PhaB subunit [Gemmobacter megaterium]|uniref:Multisubunit potassium/proton antiporter, PhaA subunit /multisubunit potassium/proton antiporter, PhaB subunit n=1 Tax=Gemmobacter megaterium TaxID=1086013 RepID=A0A1N7PDQ4_9RHOB|nr:monovalent cation/H+ antiporter subunit A [Gemmobacter megaterium]GGE18866.1 monovalent cation/H+ antiporter subunit A [Gemmobacter megaterium]SIT08742.1 multisubunit potassium/proton antiporter, PhaA subunit /multisubunit potassium/proton antiporter, PhaB subunit [Gemmobacter megaterium]